MIEPVKEDKKPLLSYPICQTILLHIYYYDSTEPSFLLKFLYKMENNWIIYFPLYEERQWKKIPQRCHNSETWSRGNPFGRYSSNCRGWCRGFSSRIHIQWTIKDNTWLVDPKSTCRCSPACQGEESQGWKIVAMASWKKPPVDILCGFPGLYQDNNTQG